MNYKLFLIIICLLLSNCNQTISSKSKIIDFDYENRYRNSGFALIYDEKLSKIKRLDQRSLSIYHKSLKKRSMVKITNPMNGNSLIAEVASNKIKFSNFYNSILTKRIVEDLELDINQPYIEIVSIPKDSTFVAKKAKTFEEERNVAEKAPIDGIQINDLNNKNDKIKKKKSKTFSYSIKVADFYYQNSAIMMIDRIKKETYMKNLRLKKLSPTKYRVLIGPFNDIKSLQESFDKMYLLNFENLEILNNV